MNTPYIVDAFRTPMARGKQGGALNGVHPVELLAHCFRELVQRNNFDPGAVDDIIVGCVSQVSEQSYTPGRSAALAAGYPTHVPSTTVERKCGSSQQAVHFAAQGIAAGAYDIVIAAGIESMSRVPMGSSRLGHDVFGPTLSAKYSPGFVSQGISAELVALRWGISRAEMDIFAAESHRRAAKAAQSGAFNAEIVPVPLEHGALVTDETIRPGTTLEGLSELKIAFKTDEMAARFPDIAWGITAGNSSQLADGASVLLLASETAVNQRGWRPRARFVGFDVIADDPLLMLTAPIPATRRVLKKAKLTIADVDHFEVNEAFASVPLAWMREFTVDPLKLNPNGGAIALGHPLGASGARIMTTMLYALERNGGRYGLQTMCEAGGMANATIIERL
jgi:acetyl-CoA acetyltransferase family protein